MIGIDLVERIADLRVAALAGGEFIDDAEMRRVVRQHRFITIGWHAVAVGAPVAVGVYGIDPVQFGVVVVLSLVLGLIHPPVGLVLFLVSSISKVSFERLSLTMIPWLAISLALLIAVAMLPAEFILWLSNWTS